MFDFAKWLEDFFLYGQLIDKGAWEKIFKEMAVHTRKATPEQLLKARRPNEEQEVFEYRVANYEPITYGSMNKAFDSLFRLMNGINYNLQISDDLRKYINDRNFCGHTLEAFLSNVVLKRDIEDPNGFLLWYPSGEGVTDNTKKIAAKPMLIYSGDLYYADENVFAFLSCEKSKIKNADNKWAMEGDVYWIFTNNHFYKLSQVGKQKNKIKDFELKLIYEHNIGDIPVICLGGDMNADGFYESFFAPYCAFGNEAIRQFSDWQAALTRSVHPHVEVFATQCELRLIEKNANRKDPDNDGKEEKYKHKIELRPLENSPHGYTIRGIPDSNGMGNVLDVNIPSKRFNAPPIENAKYSGESWQLLLSKAEDALHLNLGQTNQSGVAKELDKEAHYSMITKIGNNYFDNIMLNSLKYVDKIVFPVLGGSKEIVINKPSTFKVKTEGDLIDEIGTLTEKKVPAIFMSSATMDLSKKYFSGDLLKQKIFEIISQEDPLYIYSREQMDSMLASSVITKEAAIRSVYMYGLLLQIANETGYDKFIQMDSTKVMEQFELLIVDYIPEETTPLFDNNGLDTYE